MLKYILLNQNLRYSDAKWQNLFTQKDISEYDKIGQIGCGGNMYLLLLFFFNMKGLNSYIFFIKP